MTYPTKNKALIEWVEEVARLTTPDRIHWCDGSAEEYDELCQMLVDAGTFTKLSEAKRPNSYYAASDPGDVARVEDRTFICSKDEADAGPTNNWRDPAEMRETLNTLFSGSMKGRTMYVVPFSMGPLGSNISHIGVEITDSPYVAVSMRIMTRMGRGALEVLGETGNFVPCLHSVGMPLDEGQADVPWPCDAENKYIVHFPETHEIISFGSGYGGNALLGKKCFALRIALGPRARRRLARRAHVGLEADEPRGRVALRDRRVPERVRQDQPRHARADPAGLEGRDGRRRHLLDEAGTRRSPLRHQSRSRILWRGARHQHGDQPQRDVLGRGQHHLHQYRASLPTATSGGRAWANRPRASSTGRASPGRKELGTPAAHPNSRFTTPADQDPAIAPEWQDPAGVPIDAILFGGRRGERDSPRLPVARLGPRGLLGFDHGLRDDGGCDRGRRQPATRPLRHAALLRIQHGRLLRDTGSRFSSASMKRSCPRSST